MALAGSEGEMSPMLGKFKAPDIIVWEAGVEAGVDGGMDGTMVDGDAEIPPAPSFSHSASSAATASLSPERLVLMSWTFIGV